MSKLNPFQFSEENLEREALIEHGIEKDDEPLIEHGIGDSLEDDEEETPSEDE